MVGRLAPTIWIPVLAQHMNSVSAREAPLVSRLSFNRIVIYPTVTHLSMLDVEHGPLTLGYDRWASLAPEIVGLQSFGHASVSEDGELTIKLINIDGNVLYEKTMTPGSTSDTVEDESSSSDNSTGYADMSASSAGSDSMMTRSMRAMFMFMLVCIMAVG
jgi:hypothetical protein